MCGCPGPGPVCGQAPRNHSFAGYTGRGIPAARNGPPPADHHDPRWGQGPGGLPLRRTFGGEPVCALRARRQFEQSRTPLGPAGERRHRVGSRPDLLAGRGAGLGRDFSACFGLRPFRPCSPDRAGRSLGPAPIQRRACRAGSRQPCGGGFERHVGGSRRHRGRRGDSPLPVGGGSLPPRR